MRMLLVILSVVALTACRGQTPPCSAYTAARTVACGLCSQLPESCPFAQSASDQAR
jgi:hypothetical protein